jgi:hypothetical protein
VYVLDRGDSQKRKELQPCGQRADLFHVDGDHSPKGCAHDILLALHNGAKAVVVDDYDFSEHVAEGADWIIKTSARRWISPRTTSATVGIGGTSSSPALPRLAIFRRLPHGVAHELEDPR